MNLKLFPYIDFSIPVTRIHQTTLTADLLLLRNMVLQDAEPYMAAQKDPAHDLEHAVRVMNTALELASLEGGGDPVILIAAAALHDVINYPKGHHKSKISAKDSAKKAAKILVQEKYQGLISAAQLEKIRDAIANHSLSDNKQQQYLESKLIQDADNLDKIGWIGILRSAAYQKTKGRSLYHPEDPRALQREPDPHKYMIDYFTQKILPIIGKFHTKAALQVAQIRMIPIYGVLQGIVQETQLSLTEQLQRFSSNN
jgi:uncharacterized protein